MSAYTLSQSKRQTLPCHNRGRQQTKRGEDITNGRAQMGRETLSSPGGVTVLCREGEFKTFWTPQANNQNCSLEA
jgi:hypothetical protein